MSLIGTVSAEYGVMLCSIPDGRQTLFSFMLNVFILVDIL